MVKIKRKFILLDAIKDSYDKPFWDKTKFLWTAFRQSNPVLALCVPVIAFVCVPLYLHISYAKLHANPVAKYYDHINIYRPDDPFVAKIRKDDSLTFKTTTMYDTIHMPGTI